MKDFKDLLREMEAGNIPYLPQYESHRCADHGYFIKRELRSGARVLQYDCGHIQLRQAAEPLPVGNRA